jgi:hypothetical protein
MNPSINLVGSQQGMNPSINCVRTCLLETSLSLQDIRRKWMAPLRSAAKRSFATSHETGNRLTMNDCNGILTEWEQLITDIAGTFIDVETTLKKQSENLFSTCETRGRFVVIHRSRTLGKLVRNRKYCGQGWERKRGGEKLVRLQG